MSTLRNVRQVAKGIPTSDGAGVKLTRVIGNQYVKNLDPFLMLDEFKSDDKADYMAGFPMHPHRGFETVTYMLKGAFRHGDNQGNTGYLAPGSIQWMTAGRGIVHEEMPNQEDGPVWGFQLWVNLPAKHKMTAPRYQDIRPEQVPEVELENGKVKVLVGNFQGVIGPVEDVVTDPLYLDFHLNDGATQRIDIPGNKSAFVYIYQGSAHIGQTDLPERHLGILGDGEGLEVTATAADTRLLVVAGDPIQEPVVQYGPFVMNTVDEVQQAIADFNEGRF
ncbi:pirin family protein [Saccharospirillum sp.]|uniref:pirin family protein n=1 Tax=Saccharospirillum sp. TaxID=2033801 RepID=UPI00349FDBE0